MKYPEATSSVNPSSASRRARVPSQFRRGVALVWSAIVLGAMVLMLGLSIDWGKAAWNLHQLHVAADAGALAGAQWIRDHAPTVTIDRAHHFAFANFADQLPVDPDTSLQSDPLTGDEEIILGRWVRQERKFYPTLVGMNAVKVIAKRQQGLGARAPAVNLIFGHMAGVDSVDLAPFATAVNEKSVGAGIICLAGDPTWQHRPTGLWIHGSGTVNLAGTHYLTGDDIIGDIQVNAESTQTTGHREALVVNGSLTINATQMNIVGASDPPGNDGDAWDDYLETIPASVWSYIDQDYLGAPRIDDPLGDIPQPVPGEAVTDEIIDDDYVVAKGELVDGIYQVELEPGYYPGGISLDSRVTGGATTTTRVILQGGQEAIYFLGGTSTGNKSGLVVQGGSSVVEKYPPVDSSGEWIEPTYDPRRGVMLFITDDGCVELHGAGADGCVQISPRGDWLADREVNGEMGVSIWQDRNNTNEAIILGNANFSLSGTLYFPNNHVEVGGTGFQAGIQLICASLDLHGTGDLGIAYDGRNGEIVIETVLVE